MTGEPIAQTRLLVVDDSKLMVKAAQKMLGGEFDIATASDGLDAWEQLNRDTSIQVVFSDLNMPRLDGYELLQKVRTSADPGLQNMPVIIVTGADNDESARMKALDLGATDFITKPFSSTDLVARARAHANYQRITRQLQAQTTLDALTGLANKAGFTDRLQQDIAYARRHQQALTLVRLEIEGLRNIFLKHGREAAELLVLHVAKLLHARIRKEDTAARIGLGGFAVSMPAGKQDGIEGWVRRLRDELAAHPPEVGGASWTLRLDAAVISAELQHWGSPQEALDTAQSLLDQGGNVAGGVLHSSAAEESGTEPAPTPPVAEAPMPAPPPKAETPAAAPAAAAVAAPLRLDPLLDALSHGDRREVVEKMPQILQRLVPVFRLLGPNQRTQLIQFLQKLGG